MPEPLPFLRDGRTRKRWRYVGLYLEDVQLCACRAEIGPARQAFWAVWDGAGGGTLHGRTALRPGGMDLAVDEGRVRLRDRGAELDLTIDEAAGTGWEARTPVGGAFTWTRKTVAPATGRLVLPGTAPRELSGRVVIDDSAGYPPRHTAWRWSAGVGVDPAGREVAWNLVTGINDAATGSERAVWVDGVATEVPPCRFADDLSAVTFPGGERLQARAHATRARADHLGVFRSRYAQPFATFRGTLPGGVEVAEGHGVLELHDVVW